MVVHIYSPKKNRKCINIRLNPLYQIPTKCLWNTWNPWQNH